MDDYVAAKRYLVTGRLRGLKSRIAVLGFAAVAALTPAAGHAQDDKAVERQVAAVGPVVCLTHPQLCGADSTWSTASSG